MVGQRSRFPRGDRLRTAADFRIVFRKGLRLDGRLFLLIAYGNVLGHDRIGLAVGKKVGGAVVRNAAKRRLREAFRRRAPRPGSDHDLVFVAKPDIASTTQGDLEHEFGQRLRRLASRQAPRPHPRPDSVR